MKELHTEYLFIKDVAELAGISQQAMQQRIMTIALPMDGPRVGKKLTVTLPSAMEWIERWKEYALVGSREAQKEIRDNWNSIVVKENEARGYVHRGKYY